MADHRTVNLAKTLVNYSVKVRTGDWVIIKASPQGSPLALEVYKEVVAAGGHPSINMISEDFGEIMLANGSEEQLLWVNPVQMMEIKKADAMIFIEAPENTRAMSGIDPAKSQLRNKAFAEWSKIYMKRSATGDLRWVMVQHPCHALAQEADMSLREYEEFVYKATFSDQKDAVACWQKVYDDQQKLVDWLQGKKKFEIHSPNADLTMSIDGRKFINSAGDNNMPSGEIFCSPVENSINGWVNFTYPAIRQGKEVQGIHLELMDGIVKTATAAKNEEFMLKMLDIDKGARRIGELGIGTNYGIQKFTKSILYDEKIGGSFHLAIGNGFEESGGKNHSAIHWDMICDVKESSEFIVDGALFYKNGKFQV
jgi:aminopeptidase